MKQSNGHTCSNCADVIPDEAPGGLCPKCALEGAATVSSTTSVGKKSAPPGIAEIAPHFPGLEIIELLGAGGMGAVYKARQPQLDRLVALKILSHDLAGDPAFVERFNREARVLARLSHPNIVGIHDFGTAGPYCYLTMELVDGVNLRQAMRAGRFTPTEALAMVQHLCAALKFAHEEGILHRDIKPENILIDSKGRVKIADFGIAKLVGEVRPHEFTLTLQGSVLGSPHYMAPEQIETPGDVDQRADIYSLGVVLYEMLTGGLPIGRFALPSEKAAMDARIDHIVMRTLEKEREARYQSAGEVGTEVEALAKSPAPVPLKTALPNVAPETARFSGLSAILTGISLPLGFILAYLFLTITPAQPNQEVSGVVKSIGAAWALFHLVATIGTALPGFILGASALGAIRKSGGTKDGLGFAIFATTAWPILALFPLVSTFVSMFILRDGGVIGSVPLIFQVILLVLFPVLVAAWLLARSLYRWAGGIVRKDGTRSHPGLGIPLLMVMPVIIGGPVLMYGVAKMILPAAESRDHVNGSASAESREAIQIQRMKFEALSSKHVRWLLGEPEVMMPVILQPGQRVSLQLLLQKPGGQHRRFDLGELTASLDEPRRLELLQVGTCLNEESVHELAAVRSGKSGHVMTVSEDLGGWEFNDDLPKKLSFRTPGSRDFTLATLPNGKGDVPGGILSLAVIVTDSIPAEDFPESQ